MAGWPDGALVGRDDLLRELAGAADDARDGTGSVVLLTGEAGIGKTSVARAVARQVRDDLAVSWGTCTADLSAPPFWPWRTVVSSETTGSSIDVEHGPEPAIGARRFERLNELREALLARARRRPLLHVVEDLQWADVASVLLLAHLGSAVVDAPLLVVATLRTGEPMPRQRQDAIEGARRTARVRHLEPLGDEDIASLVRGAGIDAGPDSTALVRARTGGNPLFVTELLRVVRATDVARRQDALERGIPTRVSELVAHELARLPSAVAEVLVTAAVIGAEGDVRTLAATLGSSAGSTLDLLEQARAAHLLDAAPPGRWRFRHELIRDAVGQAVTGTSRARLHATVLEVLAADSSTPTPVLAHHALAARPLFDDDRAVALAARAGEAAFAQHAYEEAVTWLERALAAAPADTSPRWRAELLVLSGECHRHMGGIEDARRSFVAAAELTDDPALLARAALGYADPGADLGIAYRSDNPVTAGLLDRAIALQPPGASPTTVLLEARLAAELYFSDQPGRARDLVDSAVERARRLGDLTALGAAVAVAHDAFTVGRRPLDEQLQESAQLLHWARESGSAAALLTAHRARAFDLLAAADIVGMDTEIVAFQRLAEPLRAPGYLWWPALWSAMRALLEGRHDEAENRALAAHQIGEGPFASLAFLNLSFLLFFLRREQGRLTELEQSVRDAVSARADIPALRVGLTFLLAELGRVDEVRGMLAVTDDRALARLHDRNWPASWFQLARAVSVAEDRRLAATLLEPANHPGERCVLVSLATVCLGAADLAAAWLHHTLGDLDAADARYRAAATINSAIGARSWLAQTHADHARMLLERDRPGDRDEACRLAAVAAGAADAIGLASVAPTLDELRRRLDRPGDVASAPTGNGARATFRRSGPVWEVEFGDRSARVPHARGMSDLAFLLGRPGEAVSVLELVDDHGTPPPTTYGAPVFDDRARRQIRDRLRELDAEIADAEAGGDGESAALAREELRSLAETVARDFGLGGRPRRLGDPVERARKTVSTRIRRAIGMVAREHPALGRHLERSIDTGAWCAYRPAEPVHWH